MSLTAIASIDAVSYTSVNNARDPTNDPIPTPVMSFSEALAYQSAQKKDLSPKLFGECHTEASCSQKVLIFFLSYLVFSIKNSA